MEKSLHVISSPKAPAAIGPYCQAMVFGDLLFTSGQIPICPESGEVVQGGIAEQARQVMENLGAVLEQAGSGFDRVIKTTCFLADMADFGVFNGVYETYFVSRPVRSCVAVKALPKGVLCEIELIATVD